MSRLPWFMASYADCDCIDPTSPGLTWATTQEKFRKYCGRFCGIEIVEIFLSAFED